MNGYISDGLRLFLRLILINIMCFLVVMSISAFGLAAFSKETGYDAYGTKKEGEKPAYLYTYSLKDGEDTKIKEYEKDGYKMTLMPNREMSKTTDAVMLLVGQVFALGILIAFIHPKIWDKGSRDCNLVKFQHEKKDILKGFKIGCIAMIPNAIMYLCMVVGKDSFAANFRVGYYKLINASFYPVYDFIMRDITNANELSVIQIILSVLPIFAVPVIAGISYYMGYYDKTVFEKLVYKKKIKK